MPLGASLPYALGRDKIFYAMKEDPCGEPEKPTIPDALCVLSTGVDFSQERRDRTDCNFGTRSMLERITGKRTVSWNVEMFLFATPDPANPTEANEPQADKLIECAMGRDSINVNTVDPNTPQGGGTPDSDFAQVLYELESGQESARTLTLYEHLSDVLSQQLVGAWVEEMTISVSGADDARISFSGGAFDLTYTGCAVLANAEVATQVTLELEDDPLLDPKAGPDAAFNFEARTLNGVLPSPPGVQIGSCISIADVAGENNVDNNGGNGYRVIAVDRTTGANTITIPAPGLAVGAPQFGKVVPFLPGSDTASRKPPVPPGEIIPGINGSFILADPADPGDANLPKPLVDDITFPVVSFSVTLTNGFKELTDTAFEDATTAFIPGMRTVEGEFTIRGRKDHIKELIKRKEFVHRYLRATFGSQPGRILQVDMPNIEMNFAAVNVPEDEEVLIPIPFKALGSGRTSPTDPVDDELRLIFK